MRARLFLRWFNQYADTQQFVIKTAEIKNKKQSDYIALIIQKTHPAFDDIIALFDSEISMFKANKDPDSKEESDSI